MVAVKEVLLYSILCAGLGVGLTITRNIPSKTLRYVAMSAFICALCFNVCERITGMPVIAGIFGGFSGASVIRYFYEQHKYPYYFSILITSVYPVCPGVAMANMFEGMLQGDAVYFMAKAERMVFVACGLTIGILLCRYICDWIFGHSLPQEIR